GPTLPRFGETPPVGCSGVPFFRIFLTQATTVPKGWRNPWTPCDLPRRGGISSPPWSATVAALAGCERADLELRIRGGWKESYPVGKKPATLKAPLHGQGTPALSADITTHHSDMPRMRRSLARPLLR